MSKRVAMCATLVAAGATCRIVLGNLALGSPVPLFGILIKVGMTETLTFVTGFVFGPIVGFVTGFLIIVVSDLFMIPGVWTPFIAAIIGVIGICASGIRRLRPQPTFRLLAVSSVVLTLLSELLQNAWVALFYAVPLGATMVSGIPSLVTAVVNNFVLFTTVGSRIISVLKKTTG